MEHLTPRLNYPMSDLMMPRQLLNVMALIYVAEQLDRAAMVFLGLFQILAKEDKDGTWEYISGLHAYRFRVEVDAWDALTNELGIDGHKLVCANHQGTMLELFTDRVYAMALEREPFLEYLSEKGETEKNLPTVEGSVRQWKHLLQQVLEE